MVLCIGAIAERGNIMVTNSKGADVTQVGEFVLGAILAFAKELFEWRHVERHPEALWNSPWKHFMWKLEDRTLLQVGLGMA